MMADLSDDFPRVEEMVRRAEKGADVVCASRYMRGGKQIGGPWFKKLLSRSAGVSLYWLAGLPTHDPTNSFKAYRTEFLKRTPIESTAGFCLGMELTVKAHFAGSRVEEVPAVWYDRTGGESRFRLWKWLPLYLTWYAWAVDRSRRADTLAVLAVVLVALALGIANIKLRPDMSYTASYVTGEHGNQLYRADRLMHGELLYRDVALSIRPYTTVFICAIHGNIWKHDRNEPRLASCREHNLSGLDISAYQGEHRHWIRALIHAIRRCAVDVMPRRSDGRLLELRIPFPGANVSARDHAPVAAAGVALRRPRCGHGCDSRAVAGSEVWRSILRGGSGHRIGPLVVLDVGHRQVRVPHLAQSIIVDARSVLGDRGHLGAACNGDATPRPCRRHALACIYG